MKSTGLVFAERPYNGEVTPTTYEDMSRYGNDGTLNSATATRQRSGLWAWSLTGAATSYIDVGNIGRLVQTTLIWLYPDDITSRSFMDLDGGTHSLETDGSGDVTATGWAGPTFYVNAVPAATRLTLSAWNLVAVTTATAFSASDFDIGREAAAYWDGLIGLVKLYNRALAAEEIGAIWQEERHLFGG